MKRAAVWLLLAMVVTPGVARAGEFWVDPVRGKPGNDGSSSAPWRSLHEMIDAGLIESRNWDSLPHTEDARLVPRNPGAPVKGGDTIYLRSGYHGDLRISGFYNTENITVVAQEGHTPRFRSVRVRASAQWVFRGIYVSPEYAPGYEKVTLFDLSSHGYHGPIHDIVVEDCHLQSIGDSSEWSATDWDTLSCPGFRVGGANMVVRNNVLRNVRSGLVVTAESSLIERNVVENFAGDGIQGLGNHTVFQYNTIRNSYDVNGNHDDGFQSWAPKLEDGSRGERVGIIVRGNTIINYEDPKQSHRGALQGIGCFGGGFVDFVVENNVVVTDHGHGITLKGARNSRIVNNTVVRPRGARWAPPKVSLIAPKDSPRCQGCVVRNNLAPAFGIDKKPGMLADHNLTVGNPTRIFVDPDGFDFHLKKRSQAVNTGSPKLAPDIDIEKVPRPWGRGYDLGAYEYHEGDVGADPPPTAAPSGASTDDELEDVGARPDTQVPTRPEPKPSATTPAEGRGFGFGYLRGLAMVLAAGALLFIAWRIGR